MVDKVALAAYCQAYSRWKQAEEGLKGGLTYENTDAKGNTSRLAKPEVAISQKYMLIIKYYCNEFGLTPNSRGRMTVPGATDQDPLDKMLGTAKN
jgi:P27 family predicted phage terminase small subunit